MNSKTASLAPVNSPASSSASFWDYVAIARPDHWTKHVFIIPGIVLAYALRDLQTATLVFNVLVGFCSAAAISSANYVINEWLDRPFDAHHPTKTKRTAVVKTLSARLVYGEYALLLALGLGLAALIAPLFLAAAAAFAAQGVVYNIPPLRSKDRVYVDVLSEAVNNPIRLLLGWAMVDPHTLPPASLLAAYWMGGAFLMGTKRLSEYREIAQTAGTAVLHRYRRSFRFYTQERLLVSSFLYALMSSFCIAVFLIKYRAEYVLALPLIGALFAVYLSLSLERDSVAQRPEKLFRERLLMSVSAAAAAVLVLLSFVDLSFVEWISIPYFLEVDDGFGVTGTAP